MLSDPLHLLFFSREIGHIFIQTCKQTSKHSKNRVCTILVLKGHLACTPLFFNTDWALLATLSCNFWHILIIILKAS